MKNTLKSSVHQTTHQMWRNLMESPFLKGKYADAPDVPTPNASTSQTEQPRADDEGEIQWMLLDCRDIPEFNFPPITEAEVCDALMIEHADDPFKGVKTFHGQYIGTFGIESNDMSRYVDKSVVLRGKQVNLTPMRKKQRQPQQVYRDPESIKIRIFESFTERSRAIYLTSILRVWGFKSSNQLKQKDVETTTTSTTLTDIL